jgi:hypothetical protein
MTFRFLMIVDLAIAIVVLYFFAAGLADGSISSFNIALWLFIIALAGGIPAGAVLLRRHARPRLANLVLLIPAVPGIVFLLFLLLMLVASPRWN